MARKLTRKQQKFVDLWDGNLKSTAKSASISYQYAKELHTRSYIKKAIKDRAATEKRDPRIATRQQRQIFWTETMNGKRNKMRDRLEASKLLGKSEADFIEKTELTGKDGGPIQVSIVDFGKIKP